MPQTYFRILVSQGDTKLFRTSRIPTAVLMIDLLARVQAGFPAAEDYDVQVLGVADGIGEVLTSEQLSQMVQAMATAKLGPMLSGVSVDKSNPEPLFFDPVNGAPN